MSRFTPGAKVTVTNPVQPTGHQGGETGVVVRTQGDLVEIRDEHGRLVTCFAEELAKH